MGKCILITSGKGGSGKSTISVGISLALAEIGKSVLVIDLDEGLRALDLMFAVESDVVFDLDDVLSRTIDAESATVKINDKLSLLVAPLEFGKINLFMFNEFCKQAREEYDYIILDCPAGFDSGFSAGILSADSAIVVLTADTLGVRDATCAAQQIKNASVEGLFIINKYSRKRLHTGVFSGIDDVIDQTSLPMLGIVPYDRALEFAGSKISINKKSKASKAFSRIAYRIIGEEVPLPPLKKI